ncbi:hypothetical protein [Pseudomonas sp. NPDC090592]|uniref:hypothetical protein n=1 Tax=Pseudomonas sp. NPDC090592 TaxID=3364480 RepID=UPI003839ED6C
MTSLKRLQRYAARVAEDPDTHTSRVKIPFKIKGNGTFEAILAACYVALNKRPDDGRKPPQGTTLGREGNASVWLKYDFQTNTQLSAIAAF